MKLRTPHGTVVEWDGTFADTDQTLLWCKVPMRDGTELRLPLSGDDLEEIQPAKKEA